MPRPVLINHCYDVLMENISYTLPANCTVLIYGIGEAAQKVYKILSNQYNIIGLLDRNAENTGRVFFGLPVFSLDRVSDVDAIIIAANIQYWDTIYNRVSEFADKKKITVYYTDGTKAIDPSSSLVMKNEYWNLSFDEFVKECEAFDIITFDIFDTLLIRKIANPTDVFYLMQSRIKDCSFASDFPYARIQAERNCIQVNGDIYNIEMIYKEVSAILNLTVEENKMLIDLELSTEIQLLSPRKDIILVFSKLIASKKNVFLISDMYFGYQYMERILSHFGIYGYARLFISCEGFGTKKSGIMWDYFSKYIHNQTFLHVGDNLDADIIKPASVGGKSFFVMKPFDMLQSSTIQKIASSSETIEDNIAQGLLQVRMFSDAFGMYNSSGCPGVNSLRDYGYIFFGPLVTTIMHSLIKKIRKKRPPVVLFIARDGYFFQNLYENIRERNEYSDLPNSIYLKASRRLCSMAAFFCPEDVYKSMQLNYVGSAKDLFFNRFGIEIEDNDEPIIRLLDKYMDTILERAKIEREHYVHYLDSLNIEKDALLFDSGQNGTIQFFLQKIIGHKLSGYYIFFADKNGRFSDCINVDALYLESRDSKFYTLSSCTNYLESVFTAPEGTYLYTDENIEFVKDKSSENYDVFLSINDIHNGIIEFFWEYYTFIKKYSLGAPSRVFVGSIIGQIKLVKLCNEIEAACRFEDSFRNSNGSLFVFESYTK